MNFNDNILVLDGAMGTMIQKYGLDERDFHKPVQADDCGDQALAAWSIGIRRLSRHWKKAGWN